MAGQPVAEALRPRLPPGLEDLIASARLHSGRAARFLADRLRADAVVLGRRVFLSRRAFDEIERRSSDAVALLAHELTHVAQYRRHGAPAFLGRYVREYLRQRFAGRSHAEAYRGISFEQEAYAAEVEIRQAHAHPTREA
jgi:hypothetical protein